LREKKEEEKIEKKIEEREVEMRGFSRGEILRGRYPLAWQKVLCYECGGLGHKRSDHREKMKKIEEKPEIKKDKIEKIEKEIKKRQRGERRKER